MERLVISEYQNLGDRAKSITNVFINDQGKMMPCKIIDFKYINKNPNAFIVVFSDGKTEIKRAVYQIYVEFSKI